jgi:putative membrane protein insertion efficiency factor
LISRLSVKLIQAYQFITVNRLPTCRYIPSCSNYAITAIEKHGWLNGGWLAILRVLRCHPLHPGGYDPVP